MADDLADVVREFLGGSRENLDNIDVDLVALESNHDDKALVARIFRALHTIKGTCGLLGFRRLEAVSHAGENVLSALRDEEIAATPVMTTVLLALVDVIRELLDQIEASGRETPGDDSRLIEQLTALYRGGTPTLEPVSAAQPAEPAQDASPALPGEPGAGE